MTDTQAMAALEPCPGCGRDGREDNAIQMAAVSLASFKSAAGGYAFRVECACGFQGPSSLNGNKAIAAWNRRAHSPEHDTIGSHIGNGGRFDPAAAEPVAWMYKNPLPGKHVPIIRLHRDPHLVDDFWTEIPLYTTPPAGDAELRKALEEARARLERYLDEEYPYAGCRDDLRDLYSFALKGVSK